MVKQLFLWNKFALEVKHEITHVNEPTAFNKCNWNTTESKSMNYIFIQYRFINICMTVKLFINNIYVLHAVSMSVF